MSIRPCLLTRGEGVVGGKCVRPVVGAWLKRVNPLTEPVEDAYDHAGEGVPAVLLPPWGARLAVPTVPPVPSPFCPCEVLAPVYAPRC